VQFGAEYVNDRRASTSTSLITYRGCLCREVDVLVESTLLILEDVKNSDRVIVIMLLVLESSLGI